MENSFIQFLVNLAPEGETMLFVRQVGKRWTPVLPAKYKPIGAWYGNTGSFIVDRLDPDRLSAASINVERVACMVLDDIGTKSKAPPLEPTWRMETSPGNEQWGYVFSLDDQPTKADFCAAISAIADAGFTDPGAINAVRNFRLPGSINLKPGRNNFASRLLEFHPDREFSLPQICQALGVTPGPASAQVQAAVVVDGGEDDEVLQWLAGEGLLLEPANSSGWCGVVCPNSDEHTNDEREGRYFPASRAYKCLHGHCQDWDSNRFLEWVAEEGGPRVEHGIRGDLMAARMAAALDTISPTPAFPDAAAQIVAEVQRQEAGRVERADWFERFAYIEPDDAYFDLQERREIARKSFNAIFRHIDCRSVHNPKIRVEASVWYDQNRQAMGAPVLSGVTYAPGESVLCARDGAVFGNKWVDGRKPGVSGNVKLWLEHAKRMIPEDEDREHVFDVMAFKLQHPNVKINHGILHGGYEGSGKDSLWHPFLWALGTANVKLVRNEEILSPWGYAFESEVIVLNELRQINANDQRALANHMKPLLAAPPEYLPINRKGMHPYEAVNRLLIVAFSNERVAISLSSTDRRWFVIWSGAPRMDERDAKKLWGWYVAGGREAVAAWLMARDVRKFNPGATPRLTDAKAIVQAAGMSAAESWLVDEMTERRGEFARGAVVAPWVRLCDRLQGTAPMNVKVVVPALLHAFQEARWIDMGLVHSRAYPAKKHLYVAPEMAHMGKSELRALAEQPNGPLRVVS